MIRVLLLLCAALLIVSGRLWSAESLWIEAETLDGVTGYCWPMAAKPSMKETKGHWALSGPGWAAEWMQGGESGFLSIACGADDDAAVATKQIEIPETGQYFVWVRYRDVREQSERFQVRLEQPGQPARTVTYGEKPMFDEDNTMKLYWNWAFAWDARPVALQKGAAKLSLLSAFKEGDCRQIDVIVITTDAQYRPQTKERPQSYTIDLLKQYQQGVPALEPLARRRGNFQAPAAWTPKTFNNRGFLYLWNNTDFDKWASGEPNTVKYPYHLRDADAKAAFEAKYAGKDDVPIFSDPRIVPTYHGAGPWVLDLESKDANKRKSAEAFRKWLDADPKRLWAGMLNYAPNTPISAKAREDFLTKYRDRYVGSISGESLGYFYVPVDKMKVATAAAKTRRELADAMSKIYLEYNAAKYREVFGQDLPAPYRDVIACQSNEMVTYVPLCFDWGARTVGYESAVATYGSIAMSQAFLRGAARQHGGMTATYRSCNFGDSATMFSEAGTYNKPYHLFDNFYDVYSGAGMGWYKFDIWYQYMAGASLFYHEQGFDEFWMPGGLTAAGRHELQLSPKGKLVDRFLRVTAKDFDRGTPYTPVALLADYAHGWSALGNTTHLFGGHGERPDLTAPNEHTQMLQSYFFTAFHPMIPHSEQPITALSESFLPAVFGDIYDVIFAYPDAKKWTTIDTYPVVIAVGDIALTQAEGQRLAEYVQRGGTLLVADAHLTGPGLAALNLPKMGAVEEAAEYRWLNETTTSPAQRFRFRAIEGGRALATTGAGKPFCAAFDRGNGRLIVLSVPYGLGINKEAIPVVPRLFAHLSRGLMPVEVEGEVEWMVNRQQNGGWIVTLLNPYGDVKPQHGIFPTDYTKNKAVTIRAAVQVRNAVDRLLPNEKLAVKDNAVALTVPAGAVRIIELR